MTAAERARANLSRGPEVRSQRATLKRAMKDGSVDALAVLRGACDEWEAVASQMPLWQLLEAIPGIGRTTASEAIVAAGLPADVRVYGLTIERRRQIAGALGKEN